MLTESTPHPCHCPLCGQPNQCAMEVERATGTKQGPCWCSTVTFAQAVLEGIPPFARGQACVCQACAIGAASGS